MHIEGQERNKGGFCGRKGAQLGRHHPCLSPSHFVGFYLQFTRCWAFKKGLAECGHHSMRSQEVAVASQKKRGYWRRPNSVAPKEKTLRKSVKVSSRMAWQHGQQSNWRKQQWQQQD